MSIDRSKPLPFHEFPTLIDKVAQLRELEAKATSGPWELVGKNEFMIIAHPDDPFYIDFMDSDKDDPEFITESRNAMPAMLDILSEIRPGDADALAIAISSLEQMITIYTRWEPTCSEGIGVLRRYQAMARKMEEESK